MFKKRRVLGIFLVLFMLVAAATTGFFIHKAQANQSNGLSMFKKLYMILDLVERSYVEEPDINTLLTGAIDGMLESLDDPYTGYLPAQDYKDMQTEFEGKYGGIGIVITMKNDQLTIVSPIEGTPGDRVDLRGGDMITAIDNISTEGMQMQKAVGLMKGNPGTKVQLSIKRQLESDSKADETKKEFKEFDVGITREEIELSYVNSDLKEDKIGYIRLTQFIEGVGKDISTEINNLHKQGAKAFILDLRNNPGGLLTEARKVTSNFIDKGPVVYVKERNGDKKPKGLFKEISTIDEPLVVLVNGGSASASEIVTGAIQDNKRGLIVGKQTFGKGVVQSVVPLPDGSAVKITTARYYTPKGRFIHHKGIKPDVVVKYDPKTKQDEQLEKAIKLLKDKLN